MRILIPILFFPFIVNAQTTFTGTVVNKNTLDKIAYATIGLVKENIGVNADENGHFNLRSKTLRPGDSLIISSVGFVTQKMAVTADTNLDIRLVEQITTLKDVILTPKHTWTNITLNESDCGNNFITSSGYLQQLAQHFVAPEENSRLIKVSICRMTGPIFKPLRTILRIRVYDMDTLTGGPGTDLCDKIIEVKSKNSSIDFNLEDYKITIPNKNFFVAIEWLKIADNEQETEPTINGIKTPTILYTPSIGMSDANDSQPEAWQLNYNGKWRPLSYNFSHRKIIALSVKVKY